MWFVASEHGTVFWNDAETTTNLIQNAMKGKYYDHLQAEE